MSKAEEKGKGNGARVSKALHRLGSSAKQHLAAAGTAAQESFDAAKQRLEATGRKAELKMLEAQAAVGKATDNLADRVSRTGVGKATKVGALAAKAVASKVAGRVVAAAEAAKALYENKPVEAARVIGTQAAAERLDDAIKYGGALANAGSSAAKHVGSRIVKYFNKDQTNPQNTEPSTASQLAADVAADEAVDSVVQSFAASKRRRIGRRQVGVRRKTANRRQNVGRRMRAAKVKASRSGKEKAYCLRCRRKVQIVSPQMKKTKRGSPFLQGTCPSCSGKVACFQKKK